MSNDAQRGKSLTDAKIILVSKSFGYGDDLMYFVPIFRRLAQVLPGLGVLVREDFPVHRYPGLPLLPLLVQITRRLERAVRGTDYAATVDIPGPSLFHRLYATRPDLVIVIEFTPVALVGALVAGLRGARLLLLIESDPGFRGAVDRGLAMRVKRLVARRADRVMTCNAAGTAWVADALKVPAEKIITAPYLTSDIGELSSSEEPSRLQRDPARINVLFLNTVNRRKGIDQLIDVALADALIAERYQFHVVGAGPDLYRAKARVAAAGLGDGFVFYGAVAYPDIAAFFHGADLFVSPTLADYRSLGGFEALSAGLPVLLSIHDGATAEVVANGVNGWSFDPLDPADLMGKMRQIAQEPALLERFAIESRRRAAWFTSERVADNLAYAATEAMR